MNFYTFNNLLSISIIFYQLLMLEQEQKSIVYKDKESPIEGSIEEKLTPSSVSIGIHTL